MACEGARSSSHAWDEAGAQDRVRLPRGRVVETWCEQRLFPLGSPGRKFRPRARKRVEDAERRRAARRPRGFERRLAGLRSLCAHNRAVRGHCDGAVRRRLVVEASPGFARHQHQAGNDTPLVGVSSQGHVPRERNPKRPSSSAQDARSAAPRTQCLVPAAAEHEGHYRCSPRGRRPCSRCAQAHGERTLLQQYQ